MKNIQFKIALLTVALTAASCKDSFLDVAPRGRLTDRKAHV